MRAILLSRVSDESQKEGYSLDAQLNRLRLYASAKGLVVPEEWVFQFDETAHKDKRAKFEQVLKLAKQVKEPVAIVADKVDRLTRNFSFQIVQLEKLRTEGKIELHFASENLILHRDSPASDLFRFGLFVQLAKFYSDSIRDNIKRSYSEMLRQGKWYAQAPYGYKHVTINGEKGIVIDETAARYVRTMFELYASGGHSFETIAQHVTNLGARTKFGNELRASFVHGTIRNPWYRGYLVSPNGEQYPHNYGRFISDELWDACQAKKRVKARVKRPFATSGFVRCGHCGFTCSPYTQKGHVYVACTKCRKSHVGEALLLTRLTSRFTELNLSEGQIHAIAGRLRNELAASEHETTATIARLRKERKRVEQRMQELLNMRLDKELTTAEYTSNNAALKKQLYDLTNQIEGMMKKQTSLDSVVEAVRKISQSVRAILAGSSSEELARFFKLCISNATLTGKEFHFTLLPEVDSLFFGADHRLWWTLDDTSRTLALDYSKLIDLANQLNQAALGAAQFASEGGTHGRMDQVTPPDSGARDA